MNETLSLLTDAEMADTNGGTVTASTSFAHDVAEWVGTAAAFYAGMAAGFFG